MSKGVGFIGQAPCYTPFSQQMSSAVGSIGSMIKEKNSQQEYFNPNYRPDYPPVIPYKSPSIFDNPPPKPSAFTEPRVPSMAPVLVLPTAPSFNSPTVVFPFLSNKF